jgi:hypothetical protein
MQNIIQIPETSFIVPTTPVLVDNFTITTHSVAIFSNFRVYKNFYEGIYGKVMAQSITATVDLLQYYPLFGTSSTSCIEDNMLVSPQTKSNLQIDNCGIDFSIVNSLATQCSSDVTRYIDPYLSIYPPCGGN